MSGSTWWARNGSQILVCVALWVVLAAVLAPSLVTGWSEIPAILTGGAGLVALLMAWGFWAVAPGVAVLVTVVLIRGDSEIARHLLGLTDGER